MVQMEKKVTRNDVARLAGVSTAVVSYVVNGTKGVSEDKRKRVLEAIEQLQYTPNAFARNLRTGRSQQIALVGDTLETQLFRRISEKLYERGFYSSLFYSVIEDAFIDRLIAMRFDAIYMTSNRFSAEQINRIARSGIPVVHYRSRSYDGLDEHVASITPDLYDGVKKSVDYLVLRGHRRFAFVPPLKYRTSGINNNDYRTRAFSEALQAHGLASEPAYYLSRTGSMDQILSDVFEILTGSAQDMRPTAFIVSEDDEAVQILQYIEKLGLRVPEDVAVMGWGNSLFSKLISPRLTTVGFDMEAYTDKVTAAIERLLDGENVEDERVPVRLIVREST